MKFPKQTADQSLLRIQLQTEPAVPSSTPDSTMVAPPASGAKVLGSVAGAVTTLAFPFEHEYRTKTLIGQGRAEDYYQTAMNDASLTVPGAPSQPIVSGGTQSVRIFNLPLGTVRTEADNESLTIRSITMPGHLRHSGEIERKFIQVGNDVYLESHGLERGFFGLLNQLLSPILFRLLDEDVISTWQKRSEAH